MLRRTVFSGQLYLWISWVILLAIYFTTVLETRGYPAALAVLVLLLVLYYAEGLEIAAATLVDKQASQVGHEGAQKALQKIKQDTEWFFAQRQVFVVTIVTFMSLMTTFDKIYVPYYSAPFYHAFGKGDAYIPVPYSSSGIPLDLPFLFTLVFTSFTILWWCQVFPKRLALRNAVKFLEQSAVLMGPIRAIGALNLPGPADQLVWLAVKYSGFSKPSSLKPSRTYFYDTAVMLYGFGIDRAFTDIGIREDGSAVVKQRLLLVFLHGNRTTATGSLSGDSEFLALPNIAIKSIYTCPMPEKVELINQQLDEIFAGRTPSPQSAGFVAHPLTALRPQLTFEPPAPGAGKKRIDWTIDFGKRLPAGLRQDSGRIVVALLYEVAVDFGQGAYLLDDYFTWTGELPSRKFSICVHPEGEAQLGFGITGCSAVVGRKPVDFPDETERMKEVIDKKAYSGELDIDHPMQGAEYRIMWEGYQT